MMIILFCVILVAVSRAVFGVIERVGAGRSSGSKKKAGLKRPK